MQRSSIMQKSTRSNSRAKTPQNKSQVPDKSNRQTQSLAKTSKLQNSNPSSAKKIQEKTTVIKNLKLQAIQESSHHNRYFYLGRGNNHEMVRSILLRRRNWIQTQNKQEYLYFKWSQSPWGFKYHLLGKGCLCFNHFQYHRQVSNKMRLVRNMINYCQTNKLNAFSYIPLTYTIDLTSGQEDMALHSFIKFYNRNLPPNSIHTRVQSIMLPRIKNQQYSTATKRPQGLFYCQPMMPKTFIAQGQQNGTPPYLWILKPTFMNRGRGVALFNSLQEFQSLIWKYYQGEDLQDFGERTFNMDQFSQNENNQSQSSKSEQKPTQNTKQGVKSQIVQDKKPQSKVWSELSKTATIIQTPTKAAKNDNLKQASTKKQLISKKASLQKTNGSAAQSTENNYNSNTPKNHEKKQTQNNGNGLKVLSFVVQKYIQSPMLINQRKFDIRVWALLTQNYEVLFFKQGYLRFSSFKYSTKHHNNPFIHLTNNSVQKHSSEYNQESGNQMYLSQMKNHMPESSYHKLQAKIREIIWISMVAARRKINVNGRKECFQIFGYDFMVDSQFKVWLIEVNTNPAIDDCSPMLKAMIPRMLDDAFKLTIDKIFGNTMLQNAQNYPVVNFKDQQNMWELLGDYREGINQKIMGRKLSFLRR